MTRRAIGLASAVLVALLAGCSDDPNTGGSDVKLLEVDNTLTQGSISGVVVDDAIRPVSGVNLTLLGQQRSVLTDAEGLFVFDALEPGLHTISAAPIPSGERRFFGIQTTAEVLAGQTTKVRIVLPTDATPQPFHTTLAYDGFFQVGSGFMDEVLELYAYNKTVGPVTTPSAHCTCAFTPIAGDVVASVVLDLAYEDSINNPAPQSGWVMDFYSIDDGRTNDLLFCEPVSPCTFHIDGAAFSNASREFHVGVWSSASWVHVNQAFELYVTFFHLVAAPEGWSFLDQQG